MRGRMKIGEWEVSSEKGEIEMNELQELGYKQGEVTVNTYIYRDREGELRGVEKPDPHTTPTDEGENGFYPCRIWIDEAGMDMRRAFNKGKPV